MIRSFFFILCVCLLASCSKEDDPKPVVSNADYFPNTTGSSWVYEGVFEGEMVITGETRKFDGKSYSELETTNSSGSSVSYLFKSGGRYYIRGFVSGVADLDLLVLKENASELSTWDQSITVNGGKNTFTYTLIEKNIEEEVDGNIFENVIVVRMDQTFKFLGTEVPVSSIVFHFAKGVGIIKIETEYDPITGLEDLNGSSELVDFEIL